MTLVETVRNEALEEAIVECSLTSDEAGKVFAAYGQWLREYGEPLGELVEVQCALAGLKAGTPKKALLEKRQSPLLAAARERLGPLRKHQNRWRFGFLESVIFSRSTRAEFEALLSHLAARFLRELVFELAPHAAEGDPPAGHPMLDALARLGVPRTLRKIDIGPALDSGFEKLELGAFPASLWSRLDHIEELKLSSSRLTLGAIDLPRVESVAIEAPFTNQLLASLVGAKWPTLQSLTLSSNAQSEEDEGGDDDRLTANRLESLLERLAQQGTLQHFGAMTEGADGDALVELLIRTNLGSTLSSLDLSRTGMTSEGATLLVARKENAFPNLESLKLAKNRIGNPEREALEYEFDEVAFERED